MSGSVEQPIDASTRFCAAYGHAVRHSASPAMQNAGLTAPVVIMRRALEKNVYA